MLRSRRHVLCIMAVHVNRLSDPDSSASYTFAFCCATAAFCFARRSAMAPTRCAKSGTTCARGGKGNWGYSKLVIVDPPRPPRFCLAATTTRPLEVAAWKQLSPPEEAAMAELNLTDCDGPL